MKHGITRVRQAAGKLIAAVVVAGLAAGLFAPPALAYEYPAQAITQSYRQSFAGGFSFYSQLDSNQKKVYDALKQLTPTSKRAVITLQSPLTFQFSSSSPTEANEQTMSNGVQNVVQSALDAVLADFPEIFWLKFNDNGSSYSYSYSISQQRGGYTYTVAALTFLPKVMDTFAASANTLVDELNAVIASFPVSGSTRYDKLKSIHDELCRRITYTYDTTEEGRVYTAYGALIDGKSVCEGYAEAFKLLCDRLEIPNVLVVGQGYSGDSYEPHKWNLVQMEDGKWYGVDVTWDDQPRIFHGFFLVGASTRDVYGKTFPQTHVAESQFSAVGQAFTYPELADKAYVFVSGGTTVTSTTGEYTVPTNPVVTEAPVIVPTTTRPVVISTTKSAATTKKAVGGQSTILTTSKTTTQDKRTSTHTTQAAAISSATTATIDSTTDSPEATDADTNPGQDGISTMRLLAMGGIALCVVFLVSLLVGTMKKSGKTKE